MKADELMLGDYVRLKRTKELVWITEIDGDRHVINNEMDGYCSEKNIDIDDVEPIPLTPEILERNGFEKHYCEDVIIYKNPYVTIEMGIKYKLYDDGHFYVIGIQHRLYYVHELQHALRLCGIDKEIEL